MSASFTRPVYVKIHDDQALVDELIEWMKEKHIFPFHTLTSDDRNGHYYVLFEDGHETAIHNFLAGRPS